MTCAFVVHGGALEVKSALLACTLRQKLHPSHRIVAAIVEPREFWGDISAETRALFDTLEIELRPIENKIDRGYPHGNKITALEGISGPALFLDSDMMVLRPFINHHSLMATDAALKVADIDTFVRGGGSWGQVYRAFNLPLPPKRFVATSTREVMREYFNAGFIWVRDGDTFSQAWIDTALRIDADDTIVNKRPWLDQIALPITFKRLRWKVEQAVTDLNYPAHLQEIGTDRPYIAHYHWPRVFPNNPILQRDLRFYLGKFPLLKEIIQIDPDWQVALPELGAPA